MESFSGSWLYEVNLGERIKSSTALHNRSNKYLQCLVVTVRTVCKGKREKIVRDTKATYSNSDGSLMQRWTKHFKGQGEPVLEFKLLTLGQRKILSTTPNFNKVCYTHKQRL